jgi:hypothetical protein
MERNGRGVLECGSKLIKLMFMEIIICFYAFPIQNGLKQWYFLLPVCFNYALKYPIRTVQEN